VLEKRARRGLLLRRNADSVERDRDLLAVALDDDGLTVGGADEADHARARARRDEEDDENAYDSIHVCALVLTHDGPSRIQCGGAEDSTVTTLRNRRMSSLSGRSSNTGSIVCRTLR